MALTRYVDSNSCEGIFFSFDVNFKRDSPVLDSSGETQNTSLTSMTKPSVSLASNTQVNIVISEDS